MVGSWFGLKHLHELGVLELGKTRQFGTLTFVPEGFWSDGWLRYGWKSISLRWSSGEAKIHNPRIIIRILSSAPYYEHIHVHMDSSQVHLSPQVQSSDSTRKEKQPFDYIFPQITLPGRGLITAGKIHLQVDSIGQWTFDNLQLRNPDSRSVQLRIQGIQGSQIAHVVQFHTKAEWKADFLTCEVRLLAAKDSIHIEAEAPLDHLDDLGAFVKIRVADVANWHRLPKDLPTLQNTEIDLQGLVQLRSLKYQWNADIQADLGAYQFLPQGLLKVNAKADDALKAEAKIRWDSRGNEQWIELSGKYRKGALEASGKIQGLDMPLRSQILPLDATLHRIHWSGDSAYADFTTGNESHAKIWMTSIKDPTAHIELDVSPTEPWVLAWTHPNLQISPPSIISGDYRRGVLTANLRTGLPFAFQATAEQFETDLTVTSKGVYFDNGNFSSRGIQHYFTGEVVLDPEQSYYQFELEQLPKGNIQVNGDFDGAIRLHVSDISTLNLPLADTSLLQGINATLNGTWDQDFANKRGNLGIQLTTDYKGMAVDLSVQARQAGDSLLLEQGVAHTQGNSLILRALALLDSTSGKPVPQWAILRTDSFSLPNFLLGFGDSTLGTAQLQGEMQWQPDSGLVGRFRIPQLTLRGTPSEELRLDRILLQGIGHKAILSGRLHYGEDGLWDNELEIQVDSLFAPTRKIAAALVTDHGGVFWTEATIDSNQVVAGNANLMGSWYLPGNGLELKGLKFHTDYLINVKEGLKGVQASFQLDSAIFAMTGLDFPFSFAGVIRQGLFTLDHLVVKGHDETSLSGSVIFDMEQKQLRSMALLSEKFNLHYLGIHHLSISDFQANALLDARALELEAHTPSIQYRLQDSSIGSIHAKLKADASFVIPNQVAGQASAPPRIEGRAEIERLIYEKTFPVELDPKLFDAVFSKAAGYFGKFAGKTNSTPVETKEKSKTSSNAKSNPIELDLRILDPGRDTLLVRTNVARIPLTLDLQVQGTIDNPLLTGDINSAGTGFIGIDALAIFDLEQLRISWQDAPLKQGQIEIKTTKDVPYCQQTEEGKIEICEVNLGVTGPLIKPVPMPYANCAVESTPAQIYYNVFLLGCFPDQNATTTDLNGLANRLLAMSASKVLNTSLGGDYFGDIDLHLQLLGQDAEAQDSSSVRIPIKLDRWVKNLRLEMAYSQNNSTGATQSGAQSYELGLKYSMPVLDSGEYVENHIEPTLNFSGNLVARRNQTTTSDAQENMLERKATVDYRWQFWDMCLFGIGFCERDQPRRPSK